MATASLTDEVIYDVLETIEYNSIQDRIVSEIKKEIEPIIGQKLKSLLENSKSLMKIARETYAH